ncbi:MAG: CHASE domain-containing protein [Roseateles sp.]|uniref:CHASE domain-containing protein n=1 Tax=Roseateles sp. TaxID=1971397 RepID=UPI0040372AF2
MNKPKRLALLTLLAGWVLSGLLIAGVLQSNQRLYEARLAVLADEVAQLVERKFGLYEFGLRGTRGAVVAAGGPAVTRSAFEAYIGTRELAREFPGARGFGFIRRVPQADEDRFLAQARADGAAEFDIRELAPHAGERFVIQYIYPADSNRGATGLDVASEARRREAALSAAREGKVRLTAPLTLVQAGSQPRRGFLVFLPIYRAGAALHTPEAREAATLGWAYAPLVVDDVLVELELRLQEIGVRLTDATETTAFFDSAHAGNLPALDAVPLASREVAIFGRRWLLQAQALQPLAAAARPQSALAVGAAAALAAGVLALLVWFVMERRQGRSADAQAAAPVTLRLFLASPLARWGGLAYFGFMAIYLVLDYRAGWHRQMDETRRTLASFVDERADRLETAQATRRKTMLFLADVPPVQGLMHALPTGVDPRDGSSLESWEKRMQQILRAHLNSSPEVAQARLIGVADGGRELVRVDRRGQDVVVIPRGGLRANGDRPYLQQALRLPAGDVWVSELDLNRENGKLEQPHRPTVRYATPVYQADGELFGAVVVNVDVTDRLAEAAAAAPAGATFYATNAAGDYVMHPDPAQRFGFEHGRQRRWSDEFQPAALPQAANHTRLQAWRGAPGLIVAATARVSPNADSAVGTLTYTASMPVARLKAAVWRDMAQNLALALGAGVTAGLLLYLYWASVQRQLLIRGQRLRLASIVDHSLDAIVGLDPQRVVTSWNRAAAQFFGIDEADAVGQPLLPLIQAPPELDALLADDARGEGGRTREFDCQGREGRPLRVSMSLSRVGGDGGGDASAIIRDVTAEHAAQAQIEALNRNLESQVLERTASLNLERQRLDNILIGTRVGTWEWNVATGATVFNERWAEIIGYRLDELAPVSIETWASLAHPEDLPKSGELLRQHFEGTAPHYSIEVRMRHRSGRWVWVLSRGQLLTRTPDGAPEWMYGTHQDITAIKEAELEVKRVAALLASVLGAATELSIIATDPQGLITLFNTGAEQLLGYQAQEMVGVSTPAPLHLPAEVIERGEALTAEYGVAVAGFRAFVHKAELEGAERRVWTYVRKDGSTVPVSLVVTAIRDEDGGVAGYLGIAHDITERLRAESALRHAKSAAEAASAAKSMFLANVSHEIRTPMNAVIGVAHLLESTPLDDDQRQLLSKLQIAGRSLLGIINDVLDLSKIEAGEMAVEVAPMKPAALLREVEQMFAPQAQAKGIGLELHGLSALPALLMTDELRLRQILVNLTSNAIKFTLHGTVSIQVTQEADAARKPWLRWRVCDTGVGIAPDVLERLFDPFVQADASTTRRFGGTGLGLSIVRKLAELMGGQVGVHSEPGQGSEFWLRLPLIEPTGNEIAALQDGGLDVVVVDDNPDDRLILARMCRSLGWRALELPSGEALAAHCKQVVDAGEAPPDAVLVDWQMPGLDGLQALVQVANEVGRKRLPAALIVSAHERSVISSLDHQQLVDCILTKPVGPSELFNAVNHSVSRHTGSTERVARSTRVAAIDSKWLMGVRVLVVDDSDINLEVARRLLERDGAIVLTAAHGREAVERLRLDPGGFDAVLMDVQMPEMDGYQATRLIRAELGLEKLPILALTAGALSEERRRAEAAGMNDFLTKPLDPQSLVSALRRAVEGARGQPLQLLAGANAPDVAVGWPEIDGIDGRDAAHRLGQDVDLFVRLLGRLLREFGTASFAVMPTQDGSEDRDALTARLHKLRGSAGLLGARDVHRLAGEAENALRAGATIADVHPGLSALDQSLQGLMQAAHPVLAAGEAVGASTLPVAQASSAVTGEALAQLVSLLHQQDLSAVQHFQALAPSLTAHWGTDYCGQVRHAVQELDFLAALQLIERAPALGVSEAAES